MMRKLVHLALVGSVIGACGGAHSIASADGERSETPPTQAPGMLGVTLENLLRTDLEGVEGTEIIVSRVSIPANTTLPKHWHPGEEFAYVLEGSVTLWQEGKNDIHYKAGDVAKVPLKQVHTAITGDEGVALLIFRVHEQGKPERVPVE